MKKITSLFAVLVLVGLANCIFLEPALAYQSEATDCASDSDSDCCFICYSMHHQWIPGLAASDSSPAIFSNPYSHQVLHFSPDPPSGSIFHPPLAL